VRAAAPTRLRDGHRAVGGIGVRRDQRQLDALAGDLVERQKGLESGDSGSSARSSSSAVAQLDG
jgi:hypothetical protein